MDQTKSASAVPSDLRSLWAEVIDHVPLVILVRSLTTIWFPRRSPSKRKAASFGHARPSARRHARLVVVLLTGTCLCRTALPDAVAQTDEAARHVASAQHLVDQLDLSNTDYAHGAPDITWTAPVASHTDCSGFIDELLTHDDGYQPQDFKRWFGSRRPTAERYHDAIVDERGFTRIASIASLRPGDLVAIKYLTRHDNTGHIMLVVEPPQSMRATPPFVPATSQWSVTVVDSSESGHGPTDTRHGRGADGRDHDGLGRGVVRLYATADGGIAGFTWSTLKSSRFISPDDEDVVLGRPVAGFRP